MRWEKYHIISIIFAVIILAVMTVQAQEAVIDTENPANEESAVNGVEQADNAEQINDKQVYDDMGKDDDAETVNIEAVNIEVAPDSSQTGYYIYYDLPDSDPGVLYEVILKVSEDGGETYSIPSSVSGDIDRGVVSGTGKRLHWEIQSSLEEAITEQTELTIETRRLAAHEIGGITIHGIPQGAEVFIDEKSIGKTPIESMMLPVDTYMMRVSHGDYEDYTGIITIEDGKNIEKNYELRSLIGYITFEGFPDGSEVFLNGKKLGETPIVSKEVPGGYYTVTIKRNGNDDYETTVNIVRAENTDLTFKIIPAAKKQVVTGNLPLISRKQAVKKSLVFPGRGQRYLGLRKKGNIITALQIVSLGGYIAAYRNAFIAVNSYDDAKDAYENADNPADIQDAWDRMKSKHDTAESASRLARVVLAGASVIYLWNVVDAVFISKQPGGMPQKHSINLTPFIDGKCSGISASMRF